MGRISSMNKRPKAVPGAQIRFPEPFFWTTARLDKMGAAAHKLHTVTPFDAARRAAVDSRVDFVVEGDSWFNHPFLLDVLDWFNAGGLSFAGSFVPGRTLAQMVHLKRYTAPLQAFNVRAFLLSGGGNDLIQWRRQSGGPSPIFKDGQSSSHPEDYIEEVEVTAAMAALARLLSQLVKDVHTVRPGLPIVTHFYDLIEPRSYKFPRGAWVNPQLNQIGVPKNQVLRNAIAARLFFLAHERYADACKSTGVTFVNLRGTVNHRWFDEIHPSNAAFRDIATKLSTAGLPSLTTRRRVKKTPPVRTPRPRSRAGSSRRRARTTIAQVVSSKRSRDRSKENKS